MEINIIKKLTVLLLWLISSQIWASSKIEGIRLWAGPNKTRVVLDLSAATKYHISYLNRPSRLLLDIKNVQLPKSVRVPTHKNSVIDEVRLFQRHNGIRFVFTLKDAISIDDFALQPEKPYGHRVVLDLRPRHRQATIARASQYIPQKIKKIIKAPVSKPQRLAPVLDPLRDVIIAIDAGHGGKDPGALGRKKIKEKDVVLAIAKALKKLVDKTKGMRVVMIRNDDRFVPLRQRIKIARQAKADLFISIHADSAPNSKATGASVYTLSRKGASSEMARWLATKENQVDLVGDLNLVNKDDDVAQMLLDLSMRGKTKESKKLADAILRQLKRNTKLHQSTVQHAGFIVLKAPDITSVLVETAFLSNKNDVKRLNSKRYQRKIAKAIMRGIQGYLNHNPPPNTLLTQLSQK